jgi:hypothetical protein
MNCVTCAGKTGVVDTVQNIPVAMGVNMNQILPSAFKRMTYIGNEGNVTSVVDNIAYGTRKIGDEMFVHASDLQSRPTLWIETVEYMPPKPKTSGRKKKVEDDVVE